MCRVEPLQIHTLQTGSSALLEIFFSPTTPQSPQELFQPLDDSCLMYDPALSTSSSTADLSSPQRVNQSSDRNSFCFCHHTWKLAYIVVCGSHLPPVTVEGVASSLCPAISPKPLHLLSHPFSCSGILDFSPPLTPSHDIISI